MTTAKEQTKMIEGELARVRAEIERLKAQEEVLAALHAKMTGGSVVSTMPRKRSPAIKPLVLDIMQGAGFTGATSGEVDEAVRRTVPGVAKDTVGSILSRLKGDGALTYDGDRYYVKQFTPKPAPFDGGLRAVN